MQAGQFFADFNTSAALARARISGDASLRAAGGINGSGYLSLIPAENYRMGTIIIPDLDAGAEVTSFTVTFYVRIGGGGDQGADGFSFCYDRDLPPVFGENSQNNQRHQDRYKFGRSFVESGLVVSFFTFLPSDGTVVSPSICVKYDDEELKRQDVPNLRTETAFVPVVITLDTRSFLHVSFDGVPVIRDLKLEKFQPKEGAQFGLGARSGALTDNHDIDDLSILTGTLAQPLAEVKTSPGLEDKLRAKVLADASGRFFSDFNSGEIPAGGQVFGDAKIESSGGVNGSGYLRLTPAEQKKMGTLLLPDLDGGQPVTSFIVAALVRVGGGQGAEGFSFCHAQNLASHFGVGGSGQGLVISFDSFVYASGLMQPPEVKIRYNGRGLTKVALAELRTGESFVPLVIKLDVDGRLDVFYGKAQVVQNFKLPSWKPLADGQFGFGANCIVATDNHCLDDLVILTGTEARPLPDLDVAAMAGLLANRYQASPNFIVESMTFLNGNDARRSIVYRPAAPGSYPAVLFCPRPQVSQASAWPFSFQPDNPFPELGELFTQNNYVLCVLSTWGQGGESSPTEAESAKTDSQWLEENEQQAGLIKDAFVGLKALETVDEDRMVVMGDGPGANAAIFAAVAETNARALVIFSPDNSPWAGNQQWQSRWKQSLETIQAPMFLLQPANARGISLFSASRQVLEKKKNANKVELFPSYGDNAAQAQEFVTSGLGLWKNDVFPFLAVHLKKNTDP